MGSAGPSVLHSWLEGAKDFVAVGIWVGNVFAVLASILTALCFLPHWTAVLWLTLLVSPSAHQAPASLPRVRDTPAATPALL